MMRSRQTLLEITVRKLKAGGEAGVRRFSLTDINDKLSNLKTSDPFLPPNTNATCALEIVPVHDNVNHQVECNDNPRDRGQTNQLGVAEECSRAVVVAVEEGCQVY